MKISSESQDSFDMKNSSNSVSILGSNRKLLNKDDESSDSAINLKILDLSDENSLILPNIFSDGDNEIEIKSKEEKKPKIFDLSFEEIVEKEMEKLAHESGSSHSSLSPCSSNLNQNASGNTNLILNTHNTENNSSAIGGIQKVNIPSLPISSMHDSLNETDSQQTEIGKLPNKHSPPLVKNESQNNHLRKTPEYLNSSLNKRNNANGDSNNNSVDHNNIFWEKTVKSFSTTQSPQNRDKKNQNSYQLHSVAANKHSNDKKVIPYVPNGDNFNDKNNKPSLSYENKSSPHAKVAPKLDLKLVKVSSPRNEKLSSPRSPDGRRNSNFSISPPPGNHIEYQTPSSQDTKKTHHESRKLSPRKSHTPKRPTNLVEQLISLRSPPSSPETGNPFQKSPPGSPRSSSPKSSPRASPKSSPPNNSLVNVKQKIKAHGNNTDPVRSKERSSVNKVQKYRQNTHSQLSKQVRNASPSVLLHNVGKIPTSQANSNYGDHQQFNTYSPSYSTTSQKQSPISSRTNSLSTTRSSARNNQMQNQTLNQNSTYEQNQRYSPQNELIKNNNFQNDQSHSNFSQIQPLKLPNKETSTDSPLRRRSRLPRRSNSPRSIPDNSPSDHSSNNPSNLNSNVSATKKINSPPVSAFATVGSLQPRTINFKNRNKPDFINTINMSPTRSFSPGNVNNYKTNLTPDYNNYPLMNNSKTLNFNNSPNKTTLNNNANRSDEKVNLIHSTSPSSSSTGQYITNMSPASSPILRKRQPKLPFRDTTPYSPLSPTGSSKQGIKMSPSLERMINGIDQLELPIDISAFESDSDYSTNG
ncbi:hypothetical protein TRFO_12572 [Tritrichomonas foetus]|uniref:Uncharacterized protein n=1 Tax=Tritrichomonas foetus TaxID=1144522 RepID=A0A1J4L1E2_9EUKA|nr:hypothetical protein TRFO_12572 [Tritrichomonas foetus]|eukprot:OHT17234.1 hypothetical protein TRFO_12572 [Tritrichomonas foetus]